MLTSMRVMPLLLTAVEHGVLPMGRSIGSGLSRRGSVWLLVAAARFLDSSSD